MELNNEQYTLTESDVIELAAHMLKMSVDLWAMDIKKARGKTLYDQTDSLSAEWIFGDKLLKHIFSEWGQLYTKYTSPTTISFRDLPTDFLKNILLD